MNLLIDDIRSFKEFTIRGCREVSVSTVAVSQVQTHFLSHNAMRLREGPSVPPERVALRDRERARTKQQ